jgi:hypothetical protein
VGAFNSCRSQAIAPYYMAALHSAHKILLCEINEIKLAESTSYDYMINGVKYDMLILSG